MYGYVRELNLPNGVPGPSGPDTLLGFGGVNLYRIGALPSLRLQLGKARNSDNWKD
jgi:hypothetical protein